MRKLKFAENKLLKHTDFINWKVDNNLKEVRNMRKYFVQKREDYTFYSKVAREIRDTALKIKELEVKDPFRIESGGQLIEKLYTMGLIPTRWNLQQCDRMGPVHFCRRRLPCILKKIGMVPDLKLAVTLIEQGHVRVGANVISDPAFLVTRNLEDFVTWVDGSAIKKHVLTYNEERDDFDIDNC